MIPPERAVVRHSITVNASQETAFATFTGGHDRWWPRDFHFGGAELEEAVPEGRERTGVGSSIAASTHTATQWIRCGVSSTRGGPASWPALRRSRGQSEVGDRLEHDREARSRRGRRGDRRRLSRRRCYGVGTHEGGDARRIGTMTAQPSAYARRVGRHR